MISHVSFEIPMYAFIHIPKTAGSTLRHTLRCCYGTSHCDIKARRRDRGEHRWLCQADLRRAQMVYPTLAGIAGHRVVSFAGLQSPETSLRFFTFVRDPLKRFESHCYHYLRGAKPAVIADGIRTFCEDESHHNVQSKWLGPEGTAAIAIATLNRDVSFVGVTEQFNESLLMFQKWMDCAKLKIPYRSRNQRANGQTNRILDDPEVRGWVEAANQEDLKLYRHIVDSVMPGQRAAYGPSLQTDLERFVSANQECTVLEEPWGARSKRNLAYKPTLCF